MAVYEFKCCGITKEVTSPMVQSVTIPKCQICNGDMARIYNTFGISFKGNGFYATDKTA